MDPATLTKAQLRAEYLARRRAMPENEWREKSDQIARRLLALPEVQSAQRILCYVSSKDNEVDSHGLIRAFLGEGKQVGVPRSMKDGLLEWRTLSDMDQIRPGTYGILEPDPDHTPLYKSPQTADCCLVPGIVWDEQGYRIGYGKGFYDRFLTNFSGLSIGLGFDWQVIPHLPCEIHDARVAHLITESSKPYS